MNHIEENSKIWDERAQNNDTWSIPVATGFGNPIECIFIAEKLGCRVYNCRFL